MISDVHHLVAQKSPDQAPSDFIEMILNWAKSIQTNKPEGLNGAILCADDDYTAIWLCWEAGADQTNLIEELASETKVWLNMESSKYKMTVGLWNNWSIDGKTDGCTQVFSSSLRIQLDRSSFNEGS